MKSTSNLTNHIIKKPFSEKGLFLAHSPFQFSLSLPFPSVVPTAMEIVTLAICGPTLPQKNR